MPGIATRTHEAGMWLEYPYVPSGCLCWWSGFHDPGCTTPLPMGHLRLVALHPGCPHRRPA